MEESQIIINPTKLLISDILDTQEKTAGGIIIPGNVKIPSMKGVIVSIGSGTDYIKISHKIGDIALYSPRAGQEIEVNGKKFRLMDVNDVWLSGSDDTVSRFGIGG